MKSRTIFHFLLSLLIISGLSLSIPASAGSAMTLGMVMGTPDLKSGGPLAFGPEGILFMGDSQGAAVFAIDLKDLDKDSSVEPVNIVGIDKKIAAMLGTPSDGVLIND